MPTMIIQFTRKSVKYWSQNAQDPNVGRETTLSGELRIFNIPGHNGSTPEEQVRLELDAYGYGPVLLKEGGDESVDIGQVSILGAAGAGEVEVSKLGHAATALQFSASIHAELLTDDMIRNQELVRVTRGVWRTPPRRYEGHFDAIVALTETQMGEYEVESGTLRLDDPAGHSTDIVGFEMDLAGDRVFFLDTRPPEAEGPSIGHGGGLHAVPPMVPQPPWTAVQPIDPGVMAESATDLAVDVSVRFVKSFVRVVRFLPVLYGTDPHTAMTGIDLGVQISAAGMVWKNCGIQVADAVPAICVDSVLQTGTTYGQIQTAFEAPPGVIRIFCVNNPNLDSLLDEDNGAVAINQGYTNAVIILRDGESHNPYLLAHEIGHVFRGVHPDDPPQFMEEGQWQGEEKTVLDANQMPIMETVSSWICQSVRNAGLTTEPTA